MKPTMRHMQAVSEEGSRLLGGASLHVPNLDVEEGGVANDLDGNAVDLAQASAQLRVVQEKSSGDVSKGGVRGAKERASPGHEKGGAAAAAAQARARAGPAAAALGLSHTSLLVMTCARKRSAMFRSKPSR
jgi:hypothetical protein